MTIAAARSAFRSSAARSAAARFASKPKSAPSAFRLPSRTPLAQRLFRSPVEMSACVDSLQPYHTATASALMMSMLTVSRCGFGWLPEGGFQSIKSSINSLRKCCKVSSGPVKLSFAVLHSFVSLVKMIIDAYGSFLKHLHTIN